MTDIANYFNIMAPGKPGSSPAATAIPAGAGAAIRLRADPPANFTNLAPHYYGIKCVATTVGTYASVCIATGDSAVGAPTATDPIVDSNDTWVFFILPLGATHIRLFGAGTGTVYFWDRGN